MFNTLGVCMSYYTTNRRLEEEAQVSCFRKVAEFYAKEEFGSIITDNINGLLVTQLFCHLYNIVVNSLKHLACASSNQS